MFSSDIQGCEKFQTLWDIASESTSARQTAYHQMKRSLRADIVAPAVRVFYREAYRIQLCLSRPTLDG